MENNPDPNIDETNQTKKIIDENRDEMIKIQIQKKEKSKMRARKKRANSIWFGLGMIGTLGWMVVLPIFLGILLGVWLDEVTNSRLPWTLILLLSGLFIGCINAISWIMQEQKEIERERKERNDDS